MAPLRFLLFVFVLKIVATAENVWYSYQQEFTQQIRDEIAITNISVDLHFTLNFPVEKWKSLCVEQYCYLGGVLNGSFVVGKVEINGAKTGFRHKISEIETPEKPIDVVFLQHLNTTTRRFETIAVITTEKIIQWYNIYDVENYFKIWEWNLGKQITHLNIFLVDYEHHVLVITKQESFSADLYKLDLSHKNFWLKQALNLREESRSVATANVGSSNYLAITQTSSNSVLIFKSQDDFYDLVANITSEGVNQVTSFHIGSKTFIALNGANARIYSVEKTTLKPYNLTNNHLEGVNYWLPISVRRKDNVILLAQRLVAYGQHASVIIDVILFNGETFEEHEDIPCNYYGEETLGLSCVPGSDSARGVEGAAFLAIDTVVGLLVPKRNSSQLFRLQLATKQAENELQKELQRMIQYKERLEKLLEEQKAMVGNSLESAEQSPVLGLELGVLDQTFDKNNTMLKDNGILHIDTLVFNDFVEFENIVLADDLTVENIEGNPADVVLADVVLVNSSSKIAGTKSVKKILTNNLEFKKLNGVEKNALRLNNAPYGIEGNVTLEQPLKIIEDAAVKKLNGESYGNLTGDFNAPVPELIFDQLQVEALKVELLNNQTVLSVNLDNNDLAPVLPPLDLFHIATSIEVERLNGLNFEEQFLKKICFTNINSYISGTTVVLGNVTIKADAVVKQLNNLNFPKEYLLSTGNGPTTVAGNKTFASVTAWDVKALDTINDRKLSEIITLSTNQSIPGTTKFTNLKISESFDVQGNITGRHSSNFLPNPTLLDTNNITATVHFKDLEVEGNIIVSGRLNKRNLGTILANIVYSSDKSARITGTTQFLDRVVVRNNFEIKSGSINDVRLAAIVTKNSDQAINMSSLTGTIDFNSIEVSGLYNGVDVFTFAEELVKLKGEQFVSAKLTFTKDLRADKLKVVKTMNSIDAEQFWGASVDAHDLQHLASSGLRGINIEGDLKAVNFPNFDFKHFDENRISVNREQVVRRGASMKTMFVENMRIERMNGKPMEQFSPEFLEKDIRRRIKDNDILIEDLIIEDSVDVGEINNVEAVDVGGSLWSQTLPKHRTLTFYFQNDVHFDKILIEKLNGVDFQKITDNLVFKNTSHVTFAGRKSFEHGLTVEKYIETRALNNIAIENIFNKYGPQEFSAPIIINGSVAFNDNIAITDELNGVPISVIQENYQENPNHFLKNNDMLFGRLPRIFNLELQGYFDGEPVQSILDNIVYKARNAQIPQLTKFKSSVFIEGNLRVLGMIDRIDLPLFMSEVVLVSKDTKIYSQVVFKDFVTIDTMKIDGNVNTKAVNSINVRTWLDKGLFLNKGYLVGNHKFSDIILSDSLITKNLNNIEMHKVIPLRSKQNLSKLNILEATIYNNLDTVKNINGYNLRIEYENTALINEGQEINTHIEFLGKVYVEGNLTFAGLMDTNKWNSVVTTNTAQTLTADYNFKKEIVLEKNFQTDFFDHINISNWNTNRIKLRADFPQIITDDWIIKGDLVVEKEMDGECSINGVNLSKYKKELGQERQNKLRLEREFRHDYLNFCKDFNFMYHKLQKQIYKFDYFEKRQMLEFHKDVTYVYNFEHHGLRYLIISEKHQCHSHIFIYTTDFHSVKTVDFGHIEQIVQVRSPNSSYLLIRNQLGYSACKYQGTNLWELRANAFVFRAKIEDQDLLEQSLIPHTFYGIRKHTVSEFKIQFKSAPMVRKLRKWVVPEDDLVFVPRNFGTGVAVTTGAKIIRLHQDQYSENDFYDSDLDGVIKGNSSQEYNTVFPGRKTENFIALTVGRRGHERGLFAISRPEETSGQRSFDVINIYEDPKKGKLSQKIVSYRPSSFTTLDFNNGETLLILMEDQSVLQVYEYRGIDGFVHKTSTKLKASKLFSLTLNGPEKPVKYLGAVNRNQIVFFEAIMLGNQVQRDLECPLL